MLVEANGMLLRQMKAKGRWVNPVPQAPGASRNTVVEIVSSQLILFSQLQTLLLSVGGCESVYSLTDTTVK